MSTAEYRCQGTAHLECGSSIPQRKMEAGMLKSSCICRRSTSPAHLLHPKLQEGKRVRQLIALACNTLSTPVHRLERHITPSSKRNV